MARAKAAAARGGAKRRGPGRPPKSAAAGFDGTLQGIVAAVKSSEQSKERYRKALDRIAAILEEALAD
jgi:hypothetical protein